MFKKPGSLTRRVFRILCLWLSVILAVQVTPLFIPANPAVLSLQASAAETAAEKKNNTDTPIHILLIGQDHREGMPGARADSIILCTFHQDARQITMTSFLRDLYVPIPGHEDNRLNAAYAYGGMELLKETLETNFGVEIDGCLEVNFSQFADVLDLLGGVTVNLRKDEADAINKAVSGNLSEGFQLLNGKQALAYTRIRNLDSDGDFSRTARQRNVLSSLLHSYEDAGLLTAFSVISEVLPLLNTDMTERKIIATIVKLLPMLSGCAVTDQLLPAEGMYSYSTVRNMSVLTADLDALRQHLLESLETPAK